MRKILLVGLMLILGISLIGCSEDVEQLERALYFDMLELHEDVIAFMDNSTERFTQNSRYSKEQLQKDLDSMVERVNKLNPPRHLRDDVELWKKGFAKFKPVAEEMIEDPLALLSGEKMGGQEMDRAWRRVRTGLIEYER